MDRENAFMDEMILDSVRSLLSAAARQGPDAVFSACHSVLEENGSDWRYLSAVSTVSAELYAKSAGKDTADAFRAVNEMTDDFAAAHAEEIRDYRMYTENRRHWLDDVPAG